MVAAMLGTPLMEWQQYVADVLLEIDPDTGEAGLRRLTLTVPRQSGKSTLILAKASHRCSATGFFGPGQHIAYTAQTKLKATEKFGAGLPGRDPAGAASRGPDPDGNVKVDIRYPNNSIFAVEAVTEKAGHGSVLDEAYIDEAFSQTDSRTETAFEPAMATRRNHQPARCPRRAGLMSAYLLGKVQAGRALVAKQLASVAARVRSAYFEWSAPEDGTRATSARGWTACLPCIVRTVRVTASGTPSGCR